MNDDITNLLDHNEINEFEEPKYSSDLKEEEKTDNISRTYEEETGVQEPGVLKWVYNPADIFQQFELYLRGIRMNHATGEYEQLYKGYYLDENGEKVLVPYKLMNDRGINDVMSVFTIYVNKVNSFSRYKAEEIDKTMKFFLFNYHERYIIHKSKEFEVDPKDAKSIVDMMYDLIRSGWRQSLGGTSLNMLGKTSKTTEIIGQGGSNKKTPRWQFW